MNILKAKIPIFSEHKNLYISSVFDGEKYYFLNKKTHEIDFFNEDYHYIARFNIGTSYDNITFDKEKEFFYLQSNTDKRKITITDMNFKTIKKISLIGIPEIDIISICYAGFENNFYLVTPDIIFSVPETISNIETLSRNSLIQKKQENHNKRESISKFTAIANICNEIYIAYCRGENAFLAKIKDREILEEYFIDDNCHIYSILNCNGEIKLCVTKNNNYIYETTIKIESNNSVDTLQKDISNNSNCLNHNEYNECSKSSDFKNCLCKIMESIAQEELRHF